MRKFDEITNANIFGKKQKNNCKISLKSLQNANEYFRIFSRFFVKVFIHWELKQSKKMEN